LCLTVEQKIKIGKYTNMNY